MTNNDAHRNDHHDRPGHHHDGPDHDHGSADHRRSTDHDDAPPVTKSDLIVTAVTPASAATGTNVVPSATVKNQGTVATPAGTILDVAFFVDGTTVWSDTKTTSLAPGASVTLTANGGENGTNYWTATAGSHTLKATVNSVNRIAETDMTNNTLTKTITNTTLPRPTTDDHDYDSPATTTTTRPRPGSSSAGVGVVGYRGDGQPVGQPCGWDHLRHARRALGGWFGDQHRPPRGRVTRRGWSRSSPA